ncbi:MAG: hypothetical protein GY945_10280 [Rhodobacteraceae bacterium]|nr:hypothetical protein [Paracoccaceae bacterium]
MPTAQNLRAAAICLICTALTPAGLQGADMRDCRLDALSFVDPWGGAVFQVERVGEAMDYYCGEGQGELVVTKDPTEASACRGPYGDLMLEGSYKGSPDDDARKVTAIWSVIWGSPCCGWEAYETTRVPAQRLAKINWYPKGTAPPLGTQPYASIDEVYGENPFFNPLIALACAHDLP